MVDSDTVVLLALRACMLFVDVAVVVPGDRSALDVIVLAVDGGSRWRAHEYRSLRVLVRRNTRW